MYHNFLLRRNKINETLFIFEKKLCLYLMNYTVINWRVHGIQTHLLQSILSFFQRLGGPVLVILILLTRYILVRLHGGLFDTTV